MMTSVAVAFAARRGARLLHVVVVLVVIRTVALPTAGVVVIRGRDVIV